eukprot:Nitzschia sp. Nitz4//scaffold19_size178191//69539//71836//NITZ4_001972-RA/size178191-snap-gene-0.145-mRNA-1//-1//CDS//3329540664//1426//frame0
MPSKKSSDDSVTRREQELNELREKALAKSQRERFEDHASARSQSQSDTQDSRDDDFDWDYALVAADSSVSAESSELNGPIIYTYQKKPPNAVSPTSTVSSFTATEYGSGFFRQEMEPKKMATDNRDKAKKIPEQLLEITEQSFDEEIVFENSHSQSFTSPRSRQSLYKNMASALSPRTKSVMGSLGPTPEESNTSQEAEVDISSVDASNISDSAQILQTPCSEKNVDSENRGSPNTPMARFFKQFISTSEEQQAAKSHELHLTISKGTEDSKTYTTGSGDSMSYRKVERRFLYAIGFLALVLGIAGVALIWLVYPSRSHDSDAATLARKESLLKVAMAVSGTDVFEDINSAQSKAYEWLAQKDPAKTSADTTPYDTLVERYVVALVYFATSGFEWNEEHGFLAIGSVCDWHSVSSGDRNRGVFCDDNDNVQQILLPDNNLAGTIPTEIAYLKYLQTVDMRGNGIKGTVPSAFGLLSHLTQLDLQSNSFYGSMPTEMGRLTTLERLDLSSNELTGTIPTEIGHLVAMKWLGLGDNQLSGSIPNTVAAMTHLEALSIFRNNLEGSVPDGIGQLDTLVSVNLASNNLEGDFDELFCSEDKVYNDLWADCGGEPPRIYCSCCTVCCAVSGRSMVCS